jgi:hypothetical protein
MKKLFIIALFVVSSITIFGQTTLDSLTTRVSYCEIVGTQGLFSKKLTINIDYGQETGSFWKPKDTRLKDENGNAIKFNSMIDVLNLMQNEGWDFVNAYAIGDAKSGYVYHWLLKRRNQ